MTEEPRREAPGIGAETCSLVSELPAAARLDAMRGAFSDLHAFFRWLGVTDEEVAEVCLEAIGPAARARPDEWGAKLRAAAVMIERRAVRESV
ncbi:hypothetical protein [Prosthecomicrobium pneumaticum]|uniref:Uncharacterized protein n=1 Tax=Prosthecomicrobium pneumaticum TaxID=81895 RepID=A0A7W9FR23_9HYPH|nr:hypothetical protein [Prosthecomicrobium pneumaticum]MBB5755307.1 hypothetical protein [Prosthecomicrobium pneumaticum]